MFRRIVLWFFGIFLISGIGYLATNYFVVPRGSPREDIARRSGAFQVNEAVHAYETGGSAALAEFLRRLDSYLPGNHYLVDREGRDLVTGEDRSQLLARAPSRRPRFRFGPPPHHAVFRINNSDGRYVFLVEIEMRGDPFANRAVFLWIVVLVFSLCYVLAWTLAKPIRELRETVTRFGNGDLSIRAKSKRHDEIGDLARSFDQMADRMQTLLTAERRLLQDVSHELRSPLARLRFAVELAKTKPDPQVAFARVNKELERLATLVGELLQVTRAEGDPEARNMQPIKTGAMLESIVADCRIEAEARGCTIDLHISGQSTWHGDKELFHRAVENVLRNAIHHSPPGSAVEVDLLAEQEVMRIRVRDYGPGVPDQHLKEIFQPFFRVEQDRSRSNGGGVGLGLAIAQRAVRVHHGEIHATNLHPGLLVELQLPR